jgi:hypothetical protein
MHWRKKAGPGGLQLSNFLTRDGLSEICYKFLLGFSFSHDKFEQWINLLTTCVCCNVGTSGEVQKHEDWWFAFMVSNGVVHKAVVLLAQFQCYVSSILIKKCIHIV